MSESDKRQGQQEFSGSSDRIAAALERVAAGIEEQNKRLSEMWAAQIELYKHAKAFNIPEEHAPLMKMAALARAESDIDSAAFREKWSLAKKEAKEKAGGNG